MSTSKKNNFKILVTGGSGRFARALKKNTGKYNMVCTRNNNFSNRGQKLVINITQGIIDNTTNFEIDNPDTSLSSSGKDYTFQVVATTIILLIIIIGILLMRRKYGSEYFSARYNNYIRSCKARV